LAFLSSSTIFVRYRTDPRGSGDLTTIDHPIVRPLVFALLRSPCSVLAELNQPPLLGFVPRHRRAPSQPLGQARRLDRIPRSHRGNASALVVSHHFDGFVRSGVAGLLHPAADLGFAAFRRPPIRSGNRTGWDGASPRHCSYPSKNSPHWQPYHITVALALLPLPRLPPSHRSVKEEDPTVPMVLRSTEMDPHATSLCCPKADRLERKARDPTLLPAVSHRGALGFKALLRR
jgi:hypothetical protein